MFFGVPLNTWLKTHFNILVLMLTLQSGLLDKTSLAEKLYRAKVDSSASKTAIKNYSRSDCGNAHLAAFHVENLASECVSENKNANFASIIQCVVAKYSGMKFGQRELEIYTAAVGNSYNRLFDLANEFYYTDYIAKLKISAVRSGECMQFNVGTAQLSAAPKDYARRENYINPPKSNPVDYVVIDDERIEFSKLPADEPQGILKIVMPERDVGISQTNEKPRRADEMLSFSLHAQNINRSQSTSTLARTMSPVASVSTALAAKRPTPHLIHTFFCMYQVQLALT